MCYSIIELSKVIIHITSQLINYVTLWLKLIIWTIILIDLNPLIGVESLQILTLLLRWKKDHSLQIRSKDLHLGIQHKVLRNKGDRCGFLNSIRKLQLLVIIKFQEFVIKIQKRILMIVHLVLITMHIKG